MREGVKGGKRSEFPFIFFKYHINAQENNCKMPKEVRRTLPNRQKVLSICQHQEKQILPQMQKINIVNSNQ
jgi:hypothetical protein